MATPPIRRSKIGTLPTNFQTVRVSDNVVISSGTDGIVYTLYDSLTRSGSVNGIRSDGWKIQTPWSVESFRYSLQTSRSRVNEVSTYTVYDPTVSWNGNVVSPPALGGQLSDLESKAITKALKQLSGKSPNLGVLIGERHETLKLFTGFAEEAVKAYRAFRRNNPKDWIKVLKHDVAPGRKLPSSWLAVQYGLQPLIQDVLGAADMANKYAMQRPPIVKCQGQASEAINFTSMDVAQSGFAMRLIEKGKHTSSVRLFYSEQSPLETAISALGINNPFTVGWELLPWSFVVDWMIPIGDYIATWGATYGWNFLDGSCTDTVRVRRDGQARFILAAPRSGTCSDHVQGNYFRMNRKVYTSSPLPRFEKKKTKNKREKEEE